MKVTGEDNVSSIGVLKEEDGMFKIKLEENSKFNVDKQVFRETS